MGLLAGSRASANSCRGQLLSRDNIGDIVSCQQYGWSVALDLVGIAEIAQMLRVTRQRVDAITRTHEDFPAPVAELASGRIWLRKEVEGWARHAGRLQ